VTRICSARSMRLVSRGRAAFERAMSRSMISATVVVSTGYPIYGSRYKDVEKRLNEAHGDAVRGSPTTLGT
jgi:hypothetical protein